MTRLRAALIALLCLSPAWAGAQGTSLDFGGLKTDTSLPVEVTADALTVNQADGMAEFTGSVLVTQGEMRLQAGAVKVEYGDGGTGISRLIASGGVTLAAGTDAAEAQTATYTVDSGEVVLEGGVLLTQGQAAISGDRLVISLQTGLGRMEGRVTTTFTPGGN
jgi:lipopolysaccharide export system protein LptA